MCQPHTAVRARNSQLRRQCQSNSSQHSPTSPECSPTAQAVRLHSFVSSAESPFSLCRTLWSSDPKYTATLASPHVPAHSGLVYLISPTSPLQPLLPTPPNSPNTTFRSQTLPIHRQIQVRATPPPCAASPPAIGTQQRPPSRILETVRPRHSVRTRFSILASPHVNSPNSNAVCTQAGTVPGAPLQQVMRPSN